MHKVYYIDGEPYKDIYLCVKKRSDRYVNIVKFAARRSTLGFSWEQAKGRIKELVREIFKRDYNISFYRVEKNNPILVIRDRTFEGSNDDYINIVENVKKSIDNKVDELYIERNKSEKRKLLEIGNRLVKMVWWEGQILKLRPRLIQNIIFLSYMLIAYDMFEQLDKIEMSKYNLVLVHFDIQDSSSAVVQYCKNIKVSTATLQHGITCAYKTSEFRSLSGLNLYGSASDFLLAWCDYNKDQAILSGRPEEQIIVTGFPGYMFSKFQSEVTDNKGLFGVVLGRVNVQENFSLIKIACELSEILNMKFVIRTHPREMRKEYIDLAKESPNYDSFFQENFTSVEEYIKYVDFSIVGNSTVYSELLFKKQRAYHYVLNRKNDIYADIPFGNFESVEELVTKIKNMDGNEAYEYLIGPDNIFERHREFLNKFL